MGLREITGYVTHVLLAVYWAWTLSRTAPQLRKRRRHRGLRTRVLLVRSGGIAVTGLLVGVIHYWATQLWHIAVAIPIAGVVGYLLHREYRRLVHAPRHRLTLVSRVRRSRAEPDLDVDILRITPLPAPPRGAPVTTAATAEAAVAAEVAAERTPPAARTDTALMGLDGYEPTPHSTWKLAMLALPEPGEPSQVIARGSLQPLRR